MRQLIDKITNLGAILSALLICILMFSIVIDVGSRTFFNSSVKGVVEFSEVFLVAIVFLGMAYAQKKGAHVSLTVLDHVLPARLLKIVNLIGLIILTSISVLLFIATGDAFINSFLDGEYRTGLLSVPLWPSKFLIVFGIGLFLIVVLYNVSDTAKAIFKKSEAIEMKKNPNDEGGK